MQDPKYLCWLDLETTALDPHDGEIIEIACVITDLDSNVRSTFQELCEPSVKALTEMDPVIIQMHEDNGLFADLNRSTTPTWDDIQADFELFLNDFPGPLILSGYGVSHMEAQWLPVHFKPEICDRFVYYHYDVSILRRLVKHVRPDKALPKDERHRALADVYAAIYEWRFYAKLMAEGLF